MRTHSMVAAMLALVMCSGTVLAEEAQTRKSLAPEGKSLRGKITKIDGKNITFEIGGVNSRPPAITFATTDATVITIGGKPAKLSNLVEGMTIDATLDHDGKNAITINMETNRKE